MVGRPEPHEYQKAARQSDESEQHGVKTLVQSPSPRLPEGGDGDKTTQDPEHDPCPVAGAGGTGIRLDPQGGVATHDEGPRNPGRVPDYGSVEYR